jgi:DNA-binding response OmpR family regulator
MCLKMIEKYPTGLKMYRKIGRGSRIPPSRKERSVIEAPPSIVMIIGADSDFTYLMQYYARKSGRQAVVCLPDKDALTLTKREQPGVIVLEGDSAEAEGWDVLQTLKGDKATCHIPVVVCSWLDQGTSRLVEGSAYYIQKPVLYEDFLTALANVECTGHQKLGNSL